MASILHIPLHDYLDTSYRPDREYVDGEIRERNVGQYEHARMQALLILWFGPHEKEWGIQGVTEQRVQVSPTRVRIPDVTLLPRGAQPEVITKPPLLAIEIPSPGYLLRHPGTRPGLPCNGRGNGVDHRSQDAVGADVLRCGMGRSLPPDGQRDSVVRRSAGNLRAVEGCLKVPN